MVQCLTRARVHAGRLVLAGATAAVVTFGASAAIAQADTPPPNPLYAVAINTGMAADQLQQEMAEQSAALNQAALANSASSFATFNPLFG